ncbi:isomerase [Hahella sp. CCB-MM4]|uniref:PhzF family phenazine biosynthesis protein n=1 Tax=Hahella sp. (strain CCB-MM4) TaxID=1926491 RepID=UPI000B9BDE80|nr:PhzF family phenazine biosynthesis protein [Hahella sp. CCB-MM4]OZG75101.1 isomerase [Hahella sp. CCB-MM4]
MQIPVYFVRSFTDSAFGGNPAAVCPLEEWLAEDVMQAIAAENAVAETAFVVNEGHGFRIRWFTPEIEMDLCGHATLAAAHVLSQRSDQPLEYMEFQSASGLLTVSVEEAKSGKTGRLYTMDLPARVPEPVGNLPEIIQQAFSVPPIAVLKSRDYILVYPDEDTVSNLQPDEQLLKQINLDPGGVVATAPGDSVDFVSRYFTPGASIFEDPVTGSAHCSLVPYWAARLDKSDLHARQISPRMGELKCVLKGGRVLLSGEVAGYLEGNITV